jgi:hypothetical protein
MDARTAATGGTFRVDVGVTLRRRLAGPIWFGVSHNPFVLEMTVADTASQIGITA